MILGHDTIAAPATAVGGALSVIRISGRDAFTICDRIFRGKRQICETPGGRLLYGRIVDGKQILDDVVISVFRAPHSYTGEDTIEISCHGSRYIISNILALLSTAGVRMAEPGEFTARAFLAGKLDLSQAEAVADMIASSSRTAHQLASSQMRGGYSDDLRNLRNELLHLSSLLELELDFSEEEVEFADRSRLNDTMQRITERIDTLRRSFSLGNALKEGVAVAIVGEPNVGKSTLLNRLLNEQRAMVSEIAGTTRDTIEGMANIDGVSFRFIDTAGLRQTDDRLEQMGIARTQAEIGRAQVIIQVTDPAHLNVPPISVEAHQQLLFVVNKIDTTPSLPLPPNAIGLSAREDRGIDSLRTALRSCIDTEMLYHGDTVVSNTRHYEALTAAGESLSQALNGLHNGLPSDLLSEEIRQVIYHLGTITGEITNDEILSNIFSKFCIGK